MKNKKIKITVLIPAYNEEANIKNIVKDVTSQQQTNFILDKLCVISDASTDNTVKILKKIKNRRLIVKDNNKRVGKIGILNSFFANFSGDALIQLDADIRLKDDKIFEDLINEINKKIDLVCGKSMPYYPKTTIEKLAFFGVKFWIRAKSLTSNSQRYECGGSIRAFSKKIIQNFHIPDGNSHITEDTYSFYFAKKHNFKVSICKKTQAYYRLPNNYRDYIKQMRRFMKSKDEMIRIFGKKLTNKYETITTQIKFKALLIEALNSPLEALGYFVLQSISKIQSIYYKQPKIWEISKSSKVLS